MGRWKMIAVRCALCVALLASCTPFPQLGNAETAQAANAPYPGLVSTAGLIDEARAGLRIDTPLEADLQQRAERLRQRAGPLRAPVLTRAERSRLGAGLSRRDG